MTRERLWPAVLLAWGLAAAVLCAALAPTIVGLRFPDPDDAMRLLEVRDWLSGQSWWDVGQHRLNGGNFPMHWSRLVDLPLAAVMLVFDPLVGPALSTRIAMTLVPMLTLLGVMGLAAGLTVRLCDIDRAKLAILLVPLSVPLVYQIRPMRIDHHGWQIACTIAAVTALFSRPTPRSGALAGAALATLLTISLEGLPVSAAIIGIGLLATTFDEDRRIQMLTMLWTLLGLLVAFHVTTRGPAIGAPACDAIAPAWIAAIGVAVTGASLSLISTTLPRWGRLVILAAAGAAGLATLAAIAPACTRGPFATLDPLVFRFWYLNVSEGLPIWEQVPAWAVMTISFPIVGLIGAALACHEARGKARIRWIMMLAIAASSFALSLLVMRTGATANALALPGGAWILHWLLTKARRIEAALPRTLATAGALVAATPGLLGSVMFGSAQPAAAAAPIAPGSSGVARPPCDDAQIADLGRIPAATLFAPLDMTPALLATTSHHAIASGYHRNAQAINRVLATFLGSADAARQSVVASGAAYVVGCPSSNETELYKSAAPDGFWARLERGERISWLQPVAMPGSPVLVWRVIGSSRRPLSPRAS